MAETKFGVTTLGIQDTQRLLRINKMSEQSVGAVCNRTVWGYPWLVRLQTAPTKENFLPGYFVAPQQIAPTPSFKQC